MTMILELRGHNDYSALDFERSEYKISDIVYILSCFTSFEQDEKIEEIESEFDCTFILHRFEDVDPKFIKFVRENVQGYDSSKSSNFYVVDWTE